MNSGRKMAGQDGTRIEPAGEGDLARISKLAGVIWRACYPGIITLEQINYMLDWMYSLDTLRKELRSGICYDLLLVGGELSGFSSYGPTEQARVFKLHKLYLLPKLHGRGLGSLLLNHCEREVRKHGGRRLMLNVNKHNVKAIKSYRRNRFVITESVVADIGNGFVMDDYVMAKDLGLSPFDPTVPSAPKLDSLAREQDSQESG
jgi:GNAT superfamily N-acetyltransferase